MIIQHNIMAINSHRQLGINNTSLGKNLEKLSSGYRINRAADDASGLAVSEKMRAQITGLDRAIMNAQDGSSLIQTAEGALQEVHSMLNRMVELATQSANGTYQADDRQKIEAEVTALKDEIDRISKSTNFNGIALLDGSLSVSTPKSVSVSGISVDEQAATAGTYGFSVPAMTGTTDNATAGQIGGLDRGDKISYNIGLNNGESYTLKFTVTDDGKYLRAEDGSLYNLATSALAGVAGSAGIMEANTLASMLTTELRKTAVNNEFTVNAAGAVLTIVSRETGTSATQISALTVSKNDKLLNFNVPQSTHANPADDIRTIASGSLVVFSKNADGTTNEDLATFTVNGEKFILVNAQALSANAVYADHVAALENKGVNVISVSTSAVVATDLGHIVTDINLKTDMAFKVNAAGTGIIIAAPEKGNGLTMQVGDTADAWNKITVSVDDMSKAGLKLTNISMASQESAANALTKIKSAIEKVSTNRGNLGALQNRLEYTMNNLGVTSENMTAAESRIRDTDMAKEMMAFTKNNVLAQAAQAMLAQANQQPQQVLQLLR